MNQEDLTPEQLLLGCLLLEAHKIASVSALVAAADFEDVRDRNLYRAIVALHQQGSPVDFITTPEEMKSFAPTEHYSRRDLVALAQAAPSATHALHYAGLVAERSFQRRTARAFAEASEQIQETRVGQGFVFETYERLKMELPGTRAAGVPGDQDTEAVEEDYQPLPLDGFSADLRRFIEYGSASTCSDPSFIAVPMLSALAGVIGNAAEVELRAGWCEPCILWTAIIGASGTRKSPALRLVKEPLKRLQVRAHLEHERALAEYRRDLAEHEARSRKPKGDVMAADAEPPRAPVLRRFCVSDVTMEALASILVAQKRGTVVIRDELSGWVRSFNQYKARGGDDEARWLELWSADALSVERRTGDERSLFVERPAVSLTGSIQPGILAEVFTRIRRESGLLARISFAYPPSVRARWQRSTEGGQSVGWFARVVERLASLPMETGSDGSPRPMRLRLSAGAEKLWGPFYEETQSRAAEFGEDGGATWAKLAGVCARIALVFEFAAWGGAETPGPLPSEIAPETLANAIRLALWFGREALRVLALLDRPGNDRELEGFEERIARRGGSVSVRDWQRMRSKRRAAEARQELQRLVDAGRARWEPSGGSAPRLLVLTGRRPVSELSVSGPSEQDAAEAESAPAREPSCPDPPGNAPTKNEPESGAGQTDGPGGDRLPGMEDQAQEAFEERAAIREYEGGLSRAAAEERALLDLGMESEPWH